MTKPNDYIVTARGPVPQEIGEKLAEAQAKAIRNSPKSGRKTNEAEVC